MYYTRFNTVYSTFCENLGWVFDFAPYPEDPDAYVEDQAVRFHRPLEEKNDDDDGKEDKERDSKGPKPTDWRWGPGES